MFTASYQIQTELVPGVEPKRFNENGRLHFYVRIFLQAGPEDLDGIELVKYTLHPTFVNPVRVSASRDTNFDIKIWSYGYFDISALLVMRDGSTREVGGYVRWPVPAGVKLEDDE